MKLVSISQIKNESDIIERFIRINSQVVDEFVIFDDRSSDNTVEILTKLQKEGYKIRFARLNNLRAQNQYRQSEIMNGLIRGCKDLNADFILPLDADEFIFESRESIEGKLSYLEPHQYGVMRWTTFIPSESLTHSKTLKEVFRPLAQEQYNNFKAIVGRKQQEQPNMTMGNHGIGGASPVDLQIELCHFPIRSANQIITKALITDLKFRMKPDRGKQEGYHISRVAKQIRESNYRVEDYLLESMARDYLGTGQVNIPYKSLPEFDSFVEQPCRYPGTLNVTQALDQFVIDIIHEANRKEAG